MTTTSARPEGSRPGAHHKPDTPFKEGPMTTPACFDDPEVACRWDDEENDCPCMQADPARQVETVPTGEYL